MSNSNNIQADKISLIYEFDNASPLFARVAQTCLDKMEVNEAVEILEKGLEIYPEYPSALIMYGKALAIKGNIEQAIESVKKASDIIGSPVTLEYYIKEIEKISREYANYDSKVAKNFVPQNFTNDNPKSEVSTATDKNEPAPVVKTKSELDLEKLTELVSKAKMPKATGMVEVDENFEYDFDNKKIVSDTLAGIHFSQGNFEEALELYKELRETKPEKADEYNLKIAEIEKAINDRID